MQEEISLPSFTLYQTSNNKYCYESQSITMLLYIAGPYSYSRRNQLSSQQQQSDNPILNIFLLGSIFNDSSPTSGQENRPDSIIKNKVEQILSNMMVKQKYKRLVFDFNFTIVQSNCDKITEAQIGDMLSVMVNLLCFGCLLSGIEIKSLFSCFSVGLCNDQIICGQRIEGQNNKRMVLAIQSSTKQSLYTEFDGQFSFLHYQKLSNMLLDINQQIQNFIMKKVIQINDRYA